MVSALFSLAALAQSPSPEALAEARRLESAMESLAERNAWTGAEAKYQALIGLDVPVTTEAHRVGAAAARATGDVASWKARSELVAAAGEHAAFDDLEVIESGFGKIMALGAPPMTMSTPPFSPDARLALAFASARLADAAWFRGMVPAGEYAWEGVSLNVEAGDGRRWLVTSAEVGLVSDPKAAIVAVGPDAWRWNGVSLGEDEVFGLLRSETATAAWVHKAEQRRRTAAILMAGGVGLIGYRAATRAAGIGLDATGPLIVGPAVLALGASVPIWISGSRARRQAFKAWDEEVAAR